MARVWERWQLKKKSRDKCCKDTLWRSLPTSGAFVWPPLPSLPVRFCSLGFHLEKDHWAIIDLIDLPPHLPALMIEPCEVPQDFSGKVLDIVKPVFANQSELFLLWGEKELTRAEICRTPIHTLLQRLPLTPGPVSFSPRQAHSSLHPVY